MYPQPSQWTPSRSVSRYQQLNRIEEGTYGVVFRARDVETGEIVAIKRLKLDKEREGFPVTSLREISGLLSIHHRNIVNLREVCVGSGPASVYLVMEYVEHELKTLIERHGGGQGKPMFSLAEVKTLIRQLLEAVNCMHEHWIVHRDLKPSNLLLTNDGIVKVADFGLARKIGDPCPAGLTEVVVTLWYRAPEILLGAAEYGEAVDLWSVGCIFGELVQGRPLFPGKGEIETMDKIIELVGLPTAAIWPAFPALPHAAKIPTTGNKYNLLERQFSSLSQHGIDLLDRLLTYDPEQRISAADALKHPFFSEEPLPKDPALFPTWPPTNMGTPIK